MNNNPYLYDHVRLRRDELIAEARHAKQCRELAGPSFLQQLATKWRRPSTGDGQTRPTQPVVA